MEGLKVLNLTAAHPHLRAGIVAYDFHKNLQQHGCESKLLTLQYDEYNDDSIISYRKSKFDQPLKRALSLLKTKQQQKQKSDPNFYFDHEDLTITINSTNSILERINGFNPDVIIVHFAQNFLTTKNLQELNERTDAHIYWYFMDMKPMTGGCAYAWDCDKYQKSCGQCPAIYSSDENDLSRKNLAFNKAQIAKTDISVLVGSELTGSQVIKSSVFKDKKVHKLFLSINAYDFKPLQKEERIAFAEKYKLNQDRIHLFFGAVKPEQKRKGFVPLMESLGLLSEIVDSDLKDKIHLIIAGVVSDQMKAEISKSGFSFDCVGFLNHNELAKTLAFADLFLCPTIQDSGPMIVNQSLMSGTPVISFKMGVSVDLVDEERGTGAVVEIGNTIAFANSIHQIIKAPVETRRQNEQACRDIAIQEFSYEVQYQNFIKIANHNIVHASNV